ncbi:MAG: anti-sigma factor, partial [Ornithinibacter sp.]
GVGWVVGAAAAGLVFGAVGSRLVGGEESAPSPVVVASTPLDTLDTSTELGYASVVDRDGGVDLDVHISPLTSEDGYLEVWLINRDLERMVSIGVLSPEQSDQSFTISPDLIDQGYVIVDISREGYDDQPQHSGDSVVRGTLPA